MNDIDNVNLLSNAVQTFVQCGKELLLICTNSSRLLYISWKKVVIEELVVVEPLIDTLNSEKRYDIIHKDRFKRRNENNLALNNVQQSDEGTYVCHYGNGFEEQVKTFLVTVYEEADKVTTVENRVKHRKVVTKSILETIETVIIFSSVAMGIIFAGSTDTISTFDR
ncbi:hypothetical protein HOLleu_00954 [Holothuria leucospilota]|uniref:Ig-like domain-containing protein n=1 Tax=Holothuria leucospilota TaxID=206669 RepID=A0A9Q1HKJ6_HOLLE|nr:hypothetical protein HOLleu_00954 [Holothuria leucospilota]